MHYQCTGGGILISGEVRGVVSHIYTVILMLLCVKGSLVAYGGDIHITFSDWKRGGKSGEQIPCLVYVHSY